MTGCAGGACGPGSGHSARSGWSRHIATGRSGHAHPFLGGPGGFRDGRSGGDQTGPGTGAAVAVPRHRRPAVQHGRPLQALGRSTRGRRGAQTRLRHRPRRPHLGRRTAGIRVAPGRYSPAAPFPRARHGFCPPTIVVDHRSRGDTITFQGRPAGGKERRSEGLLNCVLTGLATESCGGSRAGPTSSRGGRGVGRPEAAPPNDWGPAVTRRVRKLQRMR